MSVSKRSNNKKVKSAFEFVDIPTRKVVNGKIAYCWDGFDVRITHKNYGVFTNKSIQGGTRFPYGGIELSSDEFAAIEHDSDLLRWIVEGFKVKRKVKTYLDGNPAHYPPRAPQNAWLGSMVNAPSIGEEANAELVLYTSRESPPNYPFVLKKPRTVVMVEMVKDVEANTEILIDYPWIQPKETKHVTPIDYTNYYTARITNGENLQELRRNKKRKISNRIEKANAAKRNNTLEVAGGILLTLGAVN